MYLLKTIESMKLKIKKRKREIVALTLIRAYPTLYILFIGINEALRFYYLFIGWFTTGVAASYIVNPALTKHVVGSFFNLYLNHVFSVFKIYVIILPVLFGLAYTFIAPVFYYSVEHVKWLLRLCSFITYVLSYLIATRSLHESRKFIETLKRSVGQYVPLHLWGFAFTSIVLNWITEIDYLTNNSQKVFENLALSGILLSFFLSFAVLLLLGYEFKKNNKRLEKLSRRR